MHGRLRQLTLIVLLTITPFWLIHPFLANADAAHAEPVVQALTPEHVGMTTKTQPTLYWYLSEVTNRPMVFTLTMIEHDSPQTLLTISLAPARAGVQHIRLKDYGVVLREEATYRWSIGLADSPDASTSVVETSATMEFVNCKKVVMDDVVSCPKWNFWYDLLEEVSEAIQKDPENKALRAKRAALLKQGGLGYLVEQYKDLGE